MTKWEYKTVYLDLDDFSLTEAEERLNALGAEGWELVRVPTPVPGVTAFCIFKRPVSSPTAAFTEGLAALAGIPPAMVAERFKEGTRDRD